MSREVALKQIERQLANGKSFKIETHRPVVEDGVKDGWQQWKSANPTTITVTIEE